MSVLTVEITDEWPPLHNYCNNQMSDPAQFLHLKRTLTSVVNLSQTLGKCVKQNHQWTNKKLDIKLGVDKVNAYPVTFVFYIL